MSTASRLFTLLSVFALLGIGTAFAQPTISSGGVVNASSYLSDIAPGSWFVVFGRNMGPGTLTLHQGAAPFPVELAGTRVSFTPAAGGSALEARIWYTSAGQLAALLPSSATAGDYDVRVTFNGQASAASRVRVIARNFGFATQAQNGQGPAQATIGSELNRFTTGTVGAFSTRPARPGDVMVLWGTGIGADTASDLNGGTSGDQTGAGQVRVIVGGIEVTPLYAGRSNGSPGLDQINFTIPQNVPLSCFVPIQVRAGGRSSNQGFISTAAAGQPNCSSSSLTPAQLSRLDAGGTLTFGAIGLSKVSTRLSVPGLGSIESSSETASGTFGRLNISQVADNNLAITQVGACIVISRIGSQDQVIAGSTGTLLDAGRSLTLNGPNATNVSLNKEGNINSYNAVLYQSGFAGIGGQGRPTIGAGTYTIAGTGGADIGAFNASVNVPGTFTWTNEASIADPISRASNLTINWTGGGDGVVAISGLSGAQTGGSQQNPIITATVFSCTAPASAGTFSVPSSVLQQLPAIQSGSTTGIGFLSVSALPDPTRNNQGVFSAPLVAGGSIDNGFFSYSIGSAKTTGWN